MPLKTLCALLAGLLGCLPQLSAQKDTEFWFAVPEVSSDHGDQPIRLRISAFDQPAIVRVTLPADPSFQPLVALLQPNQASTIELSNFKEILENKPPDMVHNKGLLIEASSPITAYYDVSSTNNPELFLLKGANALGKRFYIPSQFALNNQIGYESFDIVATRDSTRITITPSQFAVGRTAGQPFTIVLNRGQTFSVRAGTQSAGGHLRGSYIESDKPIAVTSSDDSIRFGNGWDLAGDQLVPVELTGTEYIAVPGYFNSERIFITATEPNTQVFINNSPSPAATLGAGQSHQIALSTQAMFIRTTAPAYVLHLSGIGDEAGSALLPPLNCTGAEQVGFIRGFGTNNLIVLTQAGNEGSFILNGNASAIPASAFQPVPGTSGEWVAARVDANPILSVSGTNLLLNTSGLFHLGVLNTSGSGAGYGYFSQFNSLYFGGEITVCRGDTAVLDAGADRQSILWNTGSTERYLRVTEPGIYWATVTFRTCTATDTVVVSVIDVPLELGPDTSFCANERLALVAGPDIGRYIWNGSVEDRFLIVDEPGLYRVSLTRDGCTVHDSIGVEALPAPQPDLGPDTALCRWQDYRLDVSLPGASYVWQDGSTGPQLRVQEAGLYHVEVTSADGCTGRDSMINRPVFEELDLGRDTLLCLGESLRFDLSFPGTSYLWQDGSTEARYEIREAGLYHVLVDNGCQTFRDSVTASYVDCSAAVHLASAFTPNGDGVNETFGPAHNGEITEFEFRIFNRWGQEVFSSDSPDAAWDGRFQGAACPAGVYVWRMSYHSIHQRRLRKVFTQGTVTLLR